VTAAPTVRGDEGLFFVGYTDDYSPGASIAVGQKAFQSSWNPVDTADAFGPGSAISAIDARPSQTWADGSCTRTREETTPWWYVDLGASEDVGFVRIYNRGDNRAIEFGSWSQVTPNPNPNPTNIFYP
jgi:hypothetical protein